MKIGIAGARGSFSEEAAEEYARKEGIADYTLDYLVSVDAVLNAVTKGSVELGVFPIENSNGGIVYEAVYGMAKYTFHIETLFEIDVQHNLLVVPGATADSVATITSHDQAIKQCRMYLKRRWPSIELKEYADTAQAAKDLAEGKLPSTTAVIAPAQAAKLYGLEILEHNIQDLKFNFTTFVAARK